LDILFDVCKTKKPKYEVRKVDVETIQQLVKTRWEITVQTDK